MLMMGMRAFAQMAGLMESIPSAVQHTNSLQMMAFNNLANSVRGSLLIMGGFAVLLQPMLTLVQESPLFVHS